VTKPVRAAALQFGVFGRWQEIEEAQQGPIGRSEMTGRAAVLCLACVLLALAASAAPQVQALGGNIYAYVSDNDQSANSTFLIGPSGILVVDTGLNEMEGTKLLREIRKISGLPVTYVVNTHYHPDHQGGNGIVGPNALVISSPFTRERTAELKGQIAKSAADTSTTTAGSAFRFELANETLEKKLTIYVGDDPVEIVSPGFAHTMGDVYVIFPRQRVIAMGDLYLTNCSPAMDQGSATNWIRSLDEILSLPADRFVPGHFEVGSRQTLQRFRDYLADLHAQVQKLHDAGATEGQVRKQIQMAKYSDFRQYPQFEATFSDNAVSMFRQMENKQ
jgi:cyclase